QILKTKLFAAGHQPFSRDWIAINIDPLDLYVQVHADVVLPVKFLLADQNALFVLLAGKEAFGERGSLVWKGTVRRNDPQLTAFQTGLDKLFRGITCHHAAAQQNGPIFAHAPENIPTLQLLGLEQSQEAIFAVDRFR